MRQFYSFDLLALVFALGCLPLMWLTALPSNNQWYFLCCLLVIWLLIIPTKFRHYKVVIAVLLLSFLWSTAYSKQYLSNTIPYIDKTLLVQAKVTSVNTRGQFTQPASSYIKFVIINLEDHSLASTIPILVYWDQPDMPMAGQIWQLKLKTKVVHSYLNQGGFDSQRFAISNRSLLTAKVVSAHLLNDEYNIKQKVVNQALPYINLFPYRDILLALAFGDRSHLEDDNRQIMLQTGVAHLMAISGMHIAMVFMLCAFICKLSLLLVSQRFIYYGMPIIFGWLCALFYAWLTGLNPPALRAILALSIWIYLRYQNYQISSWQKINRIIAALLLFDPLMILSDSFWLSCYAVLSLVFLYEWLPLPKYMQRQKRWYLVRLLHLQLGLILLLLPIQLWVFHGTSLVSLLTNLIAIPTILLLTFPIILLALLFSLINCFHVALGCWFIAEQSLEWLFYCLNQFNCGWFTIAANGYLLSLSGWLVIIVIRTECWRRFFMTLLVILVILITPFFKQQDFLWRLDILDVGHGLAVIIHNGKSAIIYDTGAKWETSSAMQRVIIPFLQWHNLEVQGIIISHQHNDHIGGLSELQQLYPKAWVMSSSFKLNNSYPCIAGNSLTWQNLTLQVLWPDKLVDYAQNENSCVIQVSDGHFKVLLTGDLERNQEYQLISRYQQKLSSTFLQMPHHGSGTSSSYAFLNYVAPDFSFASTSRYNPWKLPSYKVINRYEELHLPYHVTAKSGQMSLFIQQNNWTLKTMRAQINPRWYHDWFGSLPIYE
ncbi:DNA internalization-related competence protein ComEC/Rec2 [Gilliamella sp. wkB178]|uniref:DNA internalization-related competence protein ComEC/Rec2 n=1 Tax=Gilliamella sp. wkB178 TaxID=3120259 RepID=UPI00080DAF8D|nr:DNA internalization-related competence protein ComEC/Rec2 [Gilliamella apicola]OCG07867.1 DNA internalization-related competence protein ComEC/Rec2 [Gilliamella apicola]